MDFSLTAAQSALQSEITTFGRTLNEGVEHDDEHKIFPREKWDRCAEFGILALQVPECYGGRGYDILTSILAMEALGLGCSDNGLTFALNGQLLVQLPLVHFASDQQKDRYLPGLAKGTELGAFAFTEPDSGSDLYSIQTKAEKTENGAYVLTGTKSLITFAPIASFAVVFATTNPAHREWGLTAFLVDLNSEGISVSEPRAKMGLRTVPAGEITFDHCLVPEAARLGNEGSGLGILNRALEWDRCCILASQLGAMERQLVECVAYARDRRQFGQSIGKFQSVSNRIADMKLRLETSRLLLYKSAWQVDQGQSAMLDAALSKLSLSENFVESSLDAIRIHGGKGYLSEFGTERSLRDSVGGILYGGTSDIQRLTIAKLLGL